MMEDEERSNTSGSGETPSSSSFSRSSITTTVEEDFKLPTVAVLATNARVKTSTQNLTTEDAAIGGKQKTSELDVLEDTMRKVADGVDDTATTTASKVVYRTEFEDHGGTEDNEPIEGPLAKGGGPVLEIVTTISQGQKLQAREPTEVSGGAPTRGLSNTANKFIDGPYEDRVYQHITLKKTEMRIHSEELIDALRIVVQYYPGQSLLGQPVTLSEPYHLLVHHQEELSGHKSACTARNDEVYRNRRNDHIDVLLDFLDRHMGRGIDEEKERSRRNPPVCTYEFLWLLFKPGEVFFDLNGTPYPFIVKSCKGGMSNGDATPYQLSAFRVNGDGETIGRENLLTKIMPFDGEQDFRALKICPAWFYEGMVNLDGKQEAQGRQALVARGKRWCELNKGFAYKEYDGKTTTSSARVVKGRVIVDFKTAFKEPRGKRAGDSDLDAPILQKDSHGTDLRTPPQGLKCTCSACAKKPGRMQRNMYDGWDSIDPHGTLPGDEEFFMLCSKNVPAFVLKERCWEWLDVGDLTETRIERDAFDSLVLDSSIKNTVKALSQSYTLSRDPSKTLPVDFIKGKGEGLIFLLHGPPGVGKTCTAECVAELTNRPLLSLTCGDIGVTAMDVEDALRNYLTLGEAWGAVVLLDEADVYLEARTVADIWRNSLVSVFLRVLEYYRGLLFLTTNRAVTFDEAFKSRIHVSLHYSKLTNAQRILIWKKSFIRLKKAGVNATTQAKIYVCSDPEILDLDLNGREIRNAFQTAIALAEFDARKKDSKVVVKEIHLRRVVEMAQHFKRYMASMHSGLNDSQLAKREGLRNDSYGEVKKSRKAEVAATMASKKKGVGRREASDEEQEDSEDEIDDEASDEEGPTNGKQGAESDDTDASTGGDEDEDDHEQDEDESEDEREPQSRARNVQPSSKMNASVLPKSKKGAAVAGEVDYEKVTKIKAKNKTRKTPK